jgi:hypothetical protein
MSTHLTLRIDAATSRKTIIEFLQKAASLDKSGGTSHLRAVEKTYRNKDGSASTVTKLFVRSGKESPIEWFKNLFSGKRQHTLAAKVLQTRLQYKVSADEPPRSDLSSALSKSSNILMTAGLRPEYRKAGVPLSTVMATVQNPAVNKTTRIN